MQAPSERGSIADLASSARPDWIRNSVWQAPQLEISSIKSWASITAMSFRRRGGEAVWRADRHRLALVLNQLPPALVQVEQGATRQMPLAAPGSLTFTPAGLTVRNVVPAAGFVQV